MRGGAKFLPPDAPPNWPSNDGCTLFGMDYVRLPIGTYLDRIGSIDGRYVAIVEKDPTTNEPKAASYISRSLRTLGETSYPTIIGGEDIPDLRKTLYDMIYNPKNDPQNELYYVLKVVKDGVRGKNPCKAKAAFEYPGGALQLGLSRSVSELLKYGYLKKLTHDETKNLLGGRNFPEYESEYDTPADHDNAFRPFNTVFNGLMNEFYASEDKRQAWRIQKGLSDSSEAPHTGTPLQRKPLTKLGRVTVQSPMTPTAKPKRANSQLTTPIPIASFMSPTQQSMTSQIPASTTSQVPASAAILRNPIQQRRPPWRG